MLYMIGIVRLRLDADRDHNARYEVPNSLIREGLSLEK